MITNADTIAQVYAAALRPCQDPFEPEASLRTAAQATGLSDWGGTRFAEDRFRQRLAALCTALESEADLTPIGRKRAHTRLHVALCSRLRLIAHHATLASPKPIVAPLIGTGFPRAGTSFFHELLAQDPENRFVTTAQAMIPVPPPGDPVIDAERSAFVDRLLDQLGFYTPEADAVHPSGPDQPDECTLIQEAALAPIFNSFFAVPSFAGLGYAHAQDLFDWEVALLQVLASTQPDGRWVLKTPEHMINWQPMLATFPDARIFLNHRDPAKVIPSICSMAMVLSGPHGRQKVPPQLIGPVLCRHLAQMMASVTAWRDAHPEVQVVDVQYKSLIADPIAEVERVYAAFCLTLSTLARTRMEGLLTRNRHGHGKQKHVYDLADFGLSDRIVEEAFGSYIESFGVERER